MLFLACFLLLQSFISVPVQAAPLLSSLFSFRPRADPVCNGDAALCARKYSEVTFIGTHDSAFIGPLPTQNQEKSITDQLNSGIRFLQSQTHNFLNSLRMCHTSCPLEDGGTVENYLREVKKWMDMNPRDVVTILLTNPDKVPMSKFDAVFKKVGLDTIAFKPSTSPNPLAMGDWPTLGSILNDGRRLITFMDYGADEKSVPYILDEFNYYFETPFDATDPNFAQCPIDRANKGNGDGKSSMYIVNHFLDIQALNIGDLNLLVPDRQNAARTNAATGSGSIGAQADVCKGLYGRYPNVVLVDYFGRGDALAAQKHMNAG